jgi:hypothetical protein
MSRLALWPEATARNWPLAWKARLAMGRPKLWQILQTPVVASHTRTCKYILATSCLKSLKAAVFHCCQTHCLSTSS